MCDPDWLPLGLALLGRPDAFHFGFDAQVVESFVLFQHVEQQNRVLVLGQDLLRKILFEVRKVLEILHRVELQLRTVAPSGYRFPRGYFSMKVCGISFDCPLCPFISCWSRSTCSRFWKVGKLCSPGGGEMTEWLRKLSSSLNLGSFLWLLAHL